VVEGGPELHTETIENLFNESIVGNSKILGKIQTFMYRRHFRPQVDMTRKESEHAIS
jgi:hypothetical protein